MSATRYSEQMMLFDVATSTGSPSAPATTAEPTTSTVPSLPPPTRETETMARPSDLLAEAEAQRVSAVEHLGRRSELGQFFTPAPVAQFMASLLEVRSLPSRLLDAGAGSGILTVAVADR
jgi:hypothetical protein